MDEWTQTIVAAEAEAAGTLGTSRGSGFSRGCGEEGAGRGLAESQYQEQETENCRGGKCRCGFEVAPSQGNKRDRQADGDCEDHKRKEQTHASVPSSKTTQDNDRWVNGNRFVVSRRSKHTAY